jgi:glycosyltransferase involved in cell wall biosynthesis
MQLSIVIPFFNEHDILTDLLKQMSGVDLPCELILVDDGSTDGGSDLARELAAGAGARYVSMDPNRGKGAAIRRGIQEASGEYLVIKDADLEQDPHDIERMWQTLQQGHFDAVFGSRILSWPQAYDIRHTANLVMTLVVNMLAKGQLSDIMTGYKMVRTDLLRSLNLSSKGFDIEPEICVKLLRKGVAIKEIPVSYKPRTITQGKKIRARDFFKVIWASIRYRLFS